MKKISILYPNKTEPVFDFEYYIENHMPRSIHLLSTHPGYRGVSVEKGLGTVNTETPVPFIAMCHYLFDSIESFVEAYSEHAFELEADMPNYTNIVPLIQFNDVIISL